MYVKRGFNLGQVGHRWVASQSTVSVYCASEMSNDAMNEIDTSRAGRLTGALPCLDWLKRELHRICKHEDRVHFAPLCEIRARSSDAGHGSGNKMISGMTQECHSQTMRQVNICILTERDRDARRHVRMCIDMDAQAVGPSGIESWQRLEIACRTMATTLRNFKMQRCSQRNRAVNRFAVCGQNSWSARDARVCMYALTPSPGAVSLTRHQKHVCTGKFSETMVIW